MNEAKQAGSADSNAARPKAMASAPFETPMAQMNLDNTVFAFTKIMWLNMPKDVMQALCTDPLGNIVVTVITIIITAIITIVVIAILRIIDIYIHMYMHGSLLYNLFDVYKILLMCYS